MSEIRPLPTTTVAPAKPVAIELASETRPGGASFKEVLRALGDETKRGEALMHRATRGGSAELSPTALIALQAGVYRYVEVVDLTSKLVDRTTQAAKTVVQSNGG